MKKINLLFVFLFGVITITNGQLKNYSTWTSAEKTKANTAKNESYLMQDEKDIIYLMNLARIDGRKFAKTYLDDYVADNGLKKTNKYIQSLYKDLKNVSDGGVLYSSENLYKSAKFHAKDMGETGQVGHSSSDGTSTFKRIKRYATGGSMAENCSYGYQKALDIVMQLLIDENVSSLGHRKNILSNSYRAVGVSIEPHQTYRFNCVQDFSDTK